MSLTYGKQITITNLIIIFFNQDSSMITQIYNKIKTKKKIKLFLL